MKMVAEQAGVSVSTVSLALRQHPCISPRTRERVARVAKELGFTRNPVVAQLMSELRKSRARGYRRTLALLNADPRTGVFSDDAALARIADGCRRRAAFQGFRCDDFWLQDPMLGPRALDRALKARGIRGGVIIGLREPSDVLVRYRSTWESIASVVVGTAPREVPLCHCGVDFFMLVREAVDRVAELGYQRPALVVDEARDERVDRRLTAGMWVAQHRFPASDRVPGFHRVRAAMGEPHDFLEWLGRHQPDVILTFNRATVDGWLASAGLAVPGDVGLVALDGRGEGGEWACMDPRGDVQGQVAVDMLVGLLNRDEVGIPDYTRAAAIAGRWVPGASVSARSGFNAMDQIAAEGDESGSFRGEARVP